MTAGPGAAPEAESDRAPGDGSRGFGLATAAFVVISSMVGTGVLTTSGITAFVVGSNGLMLALWVVGAVIALCGALTLAELSAALPRTGGDYVYLTEAYGPLAGFLSGWVSFLLGFGGPIAASAFAAATYLLAPLALRGASATLAQQGVATAAILLFAVVHVSGRSRTVAVQAGITVAKLVILSALAAAGLAAGWGRWSNVADVPPLDRSTLGTMAFSLVYVSYAYTGWNGASYLAGEIDQPQKRLPAAILAGTGVVVVLYLALNLFYAFALSVADLRGIVAASGLPPGRSIDAVAPIAALASRRVFGPRVAGPLSVAVGLTLLASLSAYVLAGPRVAYAMARAGQFPAIAGRLSARTGAPAVATALQVAWALALLWTGSFERIMVYASVGLALVSMLTVASVYVLRRRQPGLPRPFRTPGYPVVPAAYLLGTGLLVVAAFVREPVVSLLSLASILAGVPAYYLWPRLGPGRDQPPPPPATG